MNENQLKMARHALGLPNKTNFTKRNYYTSTPGCDGWDDLEGLVSDGLAVKTKYHTEYVFNLTLEGAKAALLPKEHLSREEAQFCRSMMVDGGAS